MPRDPLAYAAALYATLYRLDRERLDWIAVEQPPETAPWAGVLDRLDGKASHSLANEGWYAEAVKQAVEAEPGRKTTEELVRKALKSLS